MSDLERDIADLDSLPRKNGELVFQAPWGGTCLRDGRGPDEAGRL